MIRKVSWILMAVFAVLIGLYPSIYFFLEPKFGVLSLKSIDLLTNQVWNLCFNAHIILGGLALLIGWIQFSPKFRERNQKLHRWIGLTYIIAVVISSLAGIYLGFFATGGFWSALGFISLGVFWFTSTAFAFLKIKNRDIYGHQKIMIYSYAACFAAVMLRLWLPLLILILKDFTSAYTLVAWLCWIPNVLVAHQITKRIPSQGLTVAD